MYNKIVKYAMNLPIFSKLSLNEREVSYNFKIDWIKLLLI